jgi:hypothetical protein
MTTFELEYILQLKSRPGGWLEQFVCDTVLTYSMYAALRFPTHHSIQRTMTTFELEYTNILNHFLTDGRESFLSANVMLWRCQSVDIGEFPKFCGHAVPD